MAGQKKDAETVVESRKLDYELLERWIKYMEKPTDKYQYKEAWQAMMKKAVAAPMGGGGGRGGGGGGWRWRRRGPQAAAAEAVATSTRKSRNWPTSSRRTSIKVMLARKELNEENEIIAAKRWKAPRKRSAPTSPTSSSPTTISVPAAASG